MTDRNSAASRGSHHGSTAQRRRRDAGNERDLRQVDLNLLKVLHVLLLERNITRTADRLFVSQSAISKSLRKLRQLFHDPLLVRSVHGLILTSRAEELLEPVANAIEQCSGLLKASPFDPRSVRATLRIAAPESFLLVAVPDLILRLRSTAPGLCIDTLHLTDNYLDLLTVGSLDFAIYLDQPYPEGFRSRLVLSATAHVWFRNRHPLRTKEKLSSADLSSYPIVTFHSPNFSQQQLQDFQRALAEHDSPMKIATSTSHLMVALDILTKSDAIMIGPGYLASLSSFNSGIVSRPLEHFDALKYPRLMQLALIQHERTVSSRLHQWIAAQIEEGYRASVPPEA